MKTFLFLLLASPILASGPKYGHKMPIEDEFENVYKDISNVLKGDVRISSVTISSLTVTNCVGCGGGSSFGNITVSTLTVTSSTTLKATSSSELATAGYYGQVISTISAGYVNVPASLNYGEHISLSIPAGHWQCHICIVYAQNGATIVFNDFGLGTSAGNTSTGLVDGTNYMTTGLPTSTYNLGNCIPGIDIHLDTATTHYLKMISQYSVATPKARGKIVCVRPR